MNVQKITANIVDIFGQKVFPATLIILEGKINSIESHGATGEINPQLPFLTPGFIDAHVHVESSMLIPSEFAKLAVVHGTVATVSDPHEIANVCGMEGVEFMIQNGKTVPFKFYFGAPSCVPATVFETAGASLDANDVEMLLQRDEIHYLSEMMNFPGVLFNDPEVMQKIAAAKRSGKPVDGHAPGLRGKEARQYIDAGISTDHECFTEEEAREKLELGMKIIIREGSAAKNFEALIGLLAEYPDHMMFCSDDKHPDSLVAGHINQLCARAIAKGLPLFHVLKAACVNPVLHYKLDVGLLRPGDAADFVVLKDLRKFEILQTYIDGKLVAENGKTLIKSIKPGEKRNAAINNFSCSPKQTSDFVFETPHLNSANGHNTQKSITIPVIEALDGQLITNRIELSVDADKKIVSDTKSDILKIAVINRYSDAVMAKALIKNFGLKKGAIASSVAHDSHNIVVVGVDDETMCRAVNLIIGEKGGISCVSAEAEMVLPLPVAGLMSEEDGYKIAEAYTNIDAMAKSLGSSLSAPFMTLSFMALLVIPHLKLSDKGLFDGNAFKFVYQT
jgi:adenine deaminase